MTNSLLKPTGQGTFLICDLRAEWNYRPYVSFWRPNNANYAYPLSWSGDYTEHEVMAAGQYYTTIEGKLLVRFPIERAAVEAIAVDPEPGRIDGDAGPVVINTPAMRRKLRRLAYKPAVVAVRERLEAESFGK